MARWFDLALGLYAIGFLSVEKGTIGADRDRRAATLAPLPKPLYLDYAQRHLETLRAWEEKFRFDSFALEAMGGPQNAISRAWESALLFLRTLDYS